MYTLTVICTRKSSSPRYSRNQVEIGETSLSLCKQREVPFGGTELIIELQRFMIITQGRVCVEEGVCVCVCV